MNKKLLALIFGAGLVLAACGGGDDNADIRYINRLWY